MSDYITGYYMTTNNDGEFFRGSKLELDAAKADGKSSPSDVESFAAYGNHITLHNCIRMYRVARGNVSWQETMQLAAIEISKELDRTRKQLIDLHNTMPATPIFTNKCK